MQFLYKKNYIKYSDGLYRLFRGLASVSLLTAIIMLILEFGIESGIPVIGFFIVTETGYSFNS